MKDKNGCLLKAGDEVLCADKEFYVAGASGDKILIWAWDFDQYGEMPIAVEASSVVKLQRSLLADLLRWYLVPLLGKRRLRFLRGKVQGSSVSRDNLPHAMSQIQRPST
jgi:hypothetical protein